MYHKNNFHKYTFCVFQEVSLESIEGLTLHYTSKSGSSYYITKEGVYRKSNHWGRVANCRWRLKTLANDQISKTKVGYAKWSDFYRDNEAEALYFIVVESQENQEIHLQHKEHSSYTHQVLRTGKDTAKRIKTIKEVLNSDQWAKYLDIDDLDSVREKLIQQLRDTNLSFQEIRRNI